MCPARRTEPSAAPTIEVLNLVETLNFSPPTTNRGNIAILLGTVPQEQKWRHRVRRYMQIGPNTQQRTHTI